MFGHNLASKKLVEWLAVVCTIQVLFMMLASFFMPELPPAKRLLDSSASGDSGSGAFGADDFFYISDFQAT